MESSGFDHDHRVPASHDDYVSAETDDDREGDNDDSSVDDCVPDDHDLPSLDNDSSVDDGPKDDHDRSGHNDHGRGDHDNRSGNYDDRSGYDHNGRSDDHDSWRDDIDDRTRLNLSRDVYDCSVILGCIDYGRTDDDIGVKLYAARDKLNAAISHYEQSAGLYDDPRGF